MRSYIISMIEQKIIHQNEVSSALRFDLVSCDRQKLVPKIIDSRLNNPIYLENAITILVNTKEYNNYLGHVTLFIIDCTIYCKIFFWKAIKDEMIANKVYLAEYSSLIGNYCVILGFAQNLCHPSAGLATKFVATKLLLDIANTLINESIFLLVEPTGACKLDESLLSDENLVLDVMTASLIGRVSSKSVPALKFAQKLGMQRMNFYHSETLGAVFFSK